MRGILKAMQEVSWTWWRHRDEAKEAYEKEKDRVLRLAAQFDELPSAGYGNILEVLTEKVNAEISEATRIPLQPEEQRIHVIRWNAMREMLDAVVNHVNDTKARRDEFKKETEDLEAQVNG